LNPSNVTAAAVFSFPGESAMERGAQRSLPTTATLLSLSMINR
jgi:hypothetical protein